MEDDLIYFEYEAIKRVSFYGVVGVAMTRFTENYIAASVNNSMQAIDLLSSDPMFSTVQGLSYAMGFTGIVSATLAAVNVHPLIKLANFSIKKSN